jgi:hypothetical protein
MTEDNFFFASVAIRTALERLPNVAAGLAIFGASVDFPIPETRDLSKFANVTTVCQTGAVSLFEAIAAVLPRVKALKGKFKDASARILVIAQSPDQVSALHPGDLIPEFNAEPAVRLEAISFVPNPLLEAACTDTRGCFCYADLYSVGLDFLISQSFADGAVREQRVLADQLRAYARENGWSDPHEFLSGDCPSEDIRREVHSLAELQELGTVQINVSKLWRVFVLMLLTNNATTEFAVAYPANWPACPPHVFLFERKEHFNVGWDGGIRMRMLDPAHWNPATTIAQILTEVKRLFVLPQAEYRATFSVREAGSYSVEGG